MGSVSGTREMIAELSSYTRLFQEIDREVENRIKPCLDRMGITSELVEQLVETTRRGEPLKPITKRRKPKKQELVVAVYDVPTPSGNSTLVFETDDGLLWQLCDAGLGWAPFDRVDPAWKPAIKFAALVPARVNPRPQTWAPWRFAIMFGTARLEVRPGRLKGQIIYGLKK